MSVVIDNVLQRSVAVKFFYCCVYSIVRSRINYMNRLCFEAGWLGCLSLQTRRVGQLPEPPAAARERRPALAIAERRLARARGEICQNMT